MNKNRWVVERTFGKVKRWFGSGKDRYKRLGLNRMHAHILMKDMSHNLYRPPWFIIFFL
ncbi:MAG: transposase [Flavobacteriales bacterium Tduv]